MYESVIFVILCATIVLCKDCLLFDQCSCQFDDGSGKVDLTSLGNKDNTPRFKDVYYDTDQMYYSYNPCGGFTEGDCSNAAACSITNDKSQQIQIGNASKTNFKYDDGSGNVVAAYTAGSGVLKLTEVSLICDPNACDPKFTVLGAQGGGSYELQMTTVCACPNRCTASGPSGCDSGKGSGSGNLTGGSIILIIFFSLFFVYLIAGVAFMKFVKKAEGKEVVPNVNFWTALPELIKDGFVFTFRQLSRPCSSYGKV